MRVELRQARQVLGEPAGSEDGGNCPVHARPQWIERSRRMGLEVDRFGVDSQGLEAARRRVDRAQLASECGG